MNYPFVLDETLSILIQSNQHYIIAVEIDGNINYYNDKTALKNGSNTGNLIGRPFYQLLSGVDKITYQMAIQNCLQDISLPITTSFNSFFDHDNPVSVQFIISVIKDKMFEPVGFLFIGQETDKKQIEKIKDQNQELLKFKKIATASNQSILITNTINQIVWINKAVTDTMGYTLADLQDKQDFQIFCGEDTGTTNIDIIKSSVCNITDIRKEMLLYNKSEGKIWVEFIKQPFYNEANKFCGFFIILNDINIKKISEKEAAHQINALKKMSFIASHEIRHEFSKIMQVTQTIKLQKPDINVYQHLLAEIEKSTQKMNMAIYELNDQINFATSNTISLESFLQQEIEEIVLIDDDKLVNQMNKIVIRSVLPNLPIKVFDDVDYALSHINANPLTKRKIIVDLTFPYKSGWYFLDEYQKMNQPWTVVILTSSLQKEDIEKSKGYNFVTHFITKPLNQQQLRDLRINQLNHLQIV